MRLDVALVDGLGAVLALDDNVRLGEAGGGVALLVLEVLGDVADLIGLLAKLFCLEVVVQNRRAGGHRVLDGYDGRQNLVIYLYQLDGFLGDVRVGRGDAGNGVPLVQRLVRRQHVVAQPLEACRALAQVNHRIAVACEVGVGYDSRHAGQRLGGRGVYALDARVRVRASQNLAVQQPGCVEVRAVQRASRNLVCPVVSHGARADDIESLRRQHHVWLVVQSLSHESKPPASALRRPARLGLSCRSRCIGTGCWRARSGSRAPTGRGFSQAAPWTPR